MSARPRPTVWHIPVCPFSQRLEILLALKGLSDAVAFQVVDITKPRDPALLARTRGTSALPILETEDGEVLTESLVLLDYLEMRFPGPAVAQAEPARRAIERMMVALEGPFTAAGYRLVMNQDAARRDDLVGAMLAQYGALDDFLMWKAPERLWLFETFGWAEAVFTPIFMRFWFLEHYEELHVPAERFPRLARWREACLEHPAAQQVSREQIIKLYYDYSRGAGNGALPPGRARSSFAFEPHWAGRPWPPSGKGGPGASDADLGLLA